MDSEASTDPGSLHTDQSPTVLVAVDDDEASFHAAAAVTRWFPPTARVVALHVEPVSPGVSATGSTLASYESLQGYPWVPPSTFVVDTADALRRGRELAQRAAEIAGGAARVESGGTEAMIIEVARGIDADVIVVGSGDRSWLSRLIDPSVSSGLARHAPCSVLVVRDKRYE